MRQFRHPAMIVAAIALFIALGGGMAIAAGGLISGSKIKNHSIPTKKLTSSAIAALKGASGPSGPPGPTNAYSVINQSSVSYNDIGATVATLTLGSGSYVLMANTTISNTTHPENTVCYLYGPNSSTVDYSYGSTSTTGGYPAQASINLVGPLTTTGGDVTEWCLTDDTTGSSYATSSRIVAIKVGTVTGTAAHFHGALKPNASANH